MEMHFWGVLKFQVWGMADIFGVNIRLLGRAYVARKLESTSHPTLGQNFDSLSTDSSKYLPWN